MTGAPLRRASAETEALTETERPAEPTPAAFHLRPAHVIVYGNPAFVAAYGGSARGCRPAKRWSTRRAPRSS
jgi:hypothetical protein